MDVIHQLGWTEVPCGHATFRTYVTHIAYITMIVEKISSQTNNLEKRTQLDDEETKKTLN
jgi:hypothetical protein